MAITCARDLMTKQFLRISTQHTLRETMGLLLYGEQKKHDVAAIAVIDQEAEFAGIITPQDVVLGLIHDWSPEEGNSDEEQFLRSAETQLKKTVGDILPAKPEKVAPDTSLAQLVKLASASGCECLPVLEDGRVEGVVYLTDIFKAAARLALNPESDGIILES